MNQFIYKSAIELAALIREGKATSTEIVSAHLDQIKKYNGQLNALISIFEEEALQEAALCDQEAALGKFRGPMHGVPITVKEQLWIKGKHSNTNFKMLKDFVAPENAVIVNRIKDSGAIILGQTNVPKNLTDYQVNGDLYPEGKNPYNTDYTPGGSTGGGAAALSAGLTPLELGGDFGGSIRVPSNYCGLYGLKPTEYTVPLNGGMPMPKNSKTYLMHMVQFGPLARNVDDLEMLWKIIVGTDESERSVADINWRVPTKNDWSEYKIAWTDGWPGYECSSQIVESINNLVQNQKANGCNAEKKIPDNDLHKESVKTWLSIAPYVIAQGAPWIVRVFIKMQLNNGLLKGVKKDYPYLIEAMNKAFKMDVNYYAEALLNRSKVTQRWEEFFDNYDFLICPVSFGPAYKRCKIGSKLNYDGKEMIYTNYAFPYVACFNASGNPSITIPLGLGKEGLPLGVQIVGKYWSEPSLIYFARKIAGITDGFVKPQGYES